MTSFWILTFAWLKFATLFYTGEGLQCYACTSYMDQCKERIAEDLVGEIFKSKCKSKCFARTGEELNGAIYRGCFDGFLEVKQLRSRSGYVGCQNLTWPTNHQMTWCLCDSDLCNGESIESLRGFTSARDNLVLSETSEEEDEGNIGPDSKEGSDDYSVDDGLVAETSHGQGYFPREHVYDDIEYEPSDNMVESGPGNDNNDSSALYVYINEDSLPSRRVEGKEESRDGEGATEGLLGGGHVNDILHEDSEIEVEDIEPYYPFEALAQYGSKKGGREIEAKASKEKLEEFYKELLGKIKCSRTGFYQNPEDCRSFVACIRDPNAKVPIVHLMRCPDGLIWDIEKKICNVGDCALDKASNLIIDPLAIVADIRQQPVDKAF